MKSILRIIGTLIISFALVLATTIPVYAWHFNGWYWSSGPVDLYFLIEDDVSVESWTGWYNGHLTWNNTQNSPTEFIFTENPNIDVITCEYGYSTSGWAGYTWFNPFYPGSINYAGVMMNEYYTDYYAYYKRVAVASHELGHTLGLAHNDGQHVMETYLSVFYDTYGIYGPTATDIDEVIALY